MSKSLKKLIDINRLREFKNKLVGTDSAYVQTGAVDQTVAGTKTFSKPIVGSVTGSSGSCTGNAATATRANSAANADTATNATNSGYTNWLRTSSHTDHLFHTEWDGSYFWTYVTAGDGGYRAVRVERSNSSGYADSAGSVTKLATARTIALSGAATGTATGFDGSGNITIPVTALSGSAITSAITIYDLVPDGAANHRNFYRGKDLTAAFNAGTVSTNIANGTFRDIFPGDYITKNVTVAATANAAAATYTIKFIIADLDIWLHRGDTSCETHHVAIVPETPPFSSYMNAGNVTTGGYVGSYMNKTVIPAFATGLQNAFGASHLISFRYLGSNTVNTSVPSAGYTGWTGASQWTNTWASYTCRLLNETMVYGSSIFASSGEDERMGGVQMAAFRLNSNLVYNRQNYWLSDVVSSAHFALMDGYGFASAYDASHVVGVRPFALLK